METKGDKYPNLLRSKHTTGLQCWKSDDNGAKTKLQQKQKHKAKAPGESVV